jgi:hypothetical protein
VKRPIFSGTGILLAMGSFVLAFLLGVLAVQIGCSPTRVISGWRAHGTPMEQNQLGYRGHPIVYSKEDFVILLVGDSQVEAHACAYDYMPEKRLEHYFQSKRKNVKVFSIGAGGYGQDQQLLALREYYKKYRANLVLLWQTPDNDIWNNVFPTHWPTDANPKPTFWLEHDQLKGPTEQIGEALPSSSIKILSLFRRFIPSISKRDTFWEKRLPAPYKPLTAYSGPVNNEWQERWKTDQELMRGENLDIEKSHFSIHLKPRSDRMLYGLELTRRLLGEIEKLAQANNGKLVIFSTFPLSDQTKLEEEVYVLNGKYYRVSKVQLRENLNYINGGFKTFDIPISLEKWRVGPANGHLNERATDEAMLNLSKVLEPMIPKS